MIKELRPNALLMIIGPRDQTAQDLNLSLSELGYRTLLSAPNPAIVAEHIKYTRPDLVLYLLNDQADKGMSEVKHICKTFGSRFPPLLIVNEQDDSALRTRALAQGAVDLLSFPCRAKQLNRFIGSVLKSSLSTRGISQQHHITDLLEAEQKGIQADNLTDPISMLPNRRAVLLDLLRRISRRQAISTLYIELEGVEQIARTFGYDVAERAIFTLAQKLKNSDVARQCSIGHWGGHHLIAIAGDRGADTTLDLARSISDCLSGDHQVDAMNVYVIARVGYAQETQSLTHAEELIRRAALAVPKRGEQATIAAYDEELDTRVSREVLIQRELLLALQAGDLELYYQPKYRLSDHRMVGAEALCRWSHDRLGFISPVEFIPTAERSGAIDQLGFWVIDTGLAQLARWFKSGRVGADFVLALNVSAAQMMRPGFSDSVRMLLDKHELSGYQLQLEITESMLIENIQHTIGELTELREQGITIALDDFGTGYSSLSYLRELPLDILKIDRVFTKNLTEQPKDMRLIQSVIAIAHTFDLRVVAEGIETQEQAQLLRTMSCDIGQGYLYSAPVPATVFPAQPMINPIAQDQFKEEEETSWPHKARFTGKLN